MVKKMLLLVLAVGCSSVFATDNNIFTGSGDGTSWTDPGNWSLGFLPYYNTDNSLYTYIGMNATSNLSVVIDDMTEAGRMWIGRPEDPAGAYKLTLETSSADLYIDRIYIGPKGIIDINDGIFSTREASFAAGTVNMKAGLLEIRSSAWSLGGTFNLSGGIVEIEAAISNDKITTMGKLNLCGGQLVVAGNGTSVVDGWISNGNRIIAYSGDTNYRVQATYDAGTNKTTVIAVVKVMAENKWDGSAGNNNWADANNWSRGSVPIYNVNESEYVYIGKDATSDCNVFIYGNARSGKAWLGRPEDPVGKYVLNVQGVEAYYYLVRMYVGPRGVLNINGGLLDTWEGRFDGGKLNINSGYLTIRSNWWGFFTGAVVTLNGGTLKIKNGTTFSKNNASITVHNPEFTGTMDFRGGKLVMDGDCRTALTWHINSGNILVFGHTPQGDELSMIYDSAANLTTVKVRNDVQVTNLWPQDLTTLTVDSRRAFQINWKSGREVENLKGYNVYVDGPSDSDLVLVSSPIAPCTATSWKIQNVTLGMSYRWRVDEVLSDGEIIPGEVWSVSIDSSELTVYERTVDGVTGLLDYQWIGCGDGSSFNDALNWYTEFTDPALAIPTYTAHEGDILESRIDGSVININGYSYCGQMYLGYGLNQTINITNGHWQTYRLRCSSGATVNIDSRSSAKWIVMESIGGTINLEGYLDIVLKYWNFKKSSGKGGIKLLDGRLLIQTMPMSSPFSAGETGNIDIYKGKFVLNGNQVTTVQGWIDSKNVVAYGGKDANNIVDVYFDSDANQTIATARQDSRLAYEPEPINNADNVDASANLSWMVGTSATSDTLYLATALKADLDKDKTVDIEDLYILIDNYLDESWLAVKEADITGDGQINMMDFAMMGNEWQNSMTFTQAGTYNHSSGDVRFSAIAALGYDTTYYWRVDSTVDGVVAAGNVWTFTTGSNPLLAYNVWPVNGDENIQRDSSNMITLTWDTNSLINSCNVYFGDNYNLVSSATVSSSAYKTNTSAKTWQTAALTNGKKYYWRIDTVQGSTVRKGNVLSFSTASAPMGLYVQGGTLKHNGSQFKGYGVNYIDPFTKLAYGATDKDFDRAFAVLGEKGIPFVRMWGSGYHVIDWQLYFNDKEQYFSCMDQVMVCAEENNVGVVFSMFWAYYLLPDLAGEHVTSWADPTSKTCKLMENYIREIYDRYKNCPAFWGWELGNEYNLAAEQNGLAPVLEVRYGHPQVRDEVLDRIDMTWAKQVATNFANAVHKVDKNRIVSNGFSCGYDPSASPAYGQPERYEDHQMADVASVHYYATGGTTASTLAAAVAAAASWGKPLYVGEFGIPESNPNGFPTVQAGFASMLNDMQTAGVTFASMWVYEYDSQNSSFNVSTSNPRSYMLDMLSSVNASMNE